MYHISNWRNLTSDPWVLEIIASYHLEFESVPIQLKLPRPPPFKEAEIQLIDEEVEKSLNKGAIQIARPRHGELLSNLFLVPKKTGDMRPVVNLKPLNEFVRKIHFKMENIQTALNFIPRGDSMISTDLKDAYFSVPIFFLLTGNICGSCGETRDMSSPVYHLATV